MGSIPGMGMKETIARWKELEALNTVDLAEAHTLSVGPQTFATCLQSNKKFNYRGVVLFEWMPRQVAIDLANGPSRGVLFYHDLELGLVALESLKDTKAVKDIVGVWLL